MNNFMNKFSWWRFSVGLPICLRNSLEHQTGFTAIRQLSLGL